MRLSEILAGCRYKEVLSGTLRVQGQAPAALQCASANTELLPDTEVSGIAYDSRKVVKGNIFVAIKGENSDGHDFINDAILRGAGVIVHEKTMSCEQSEACNEAGPVFIRVEDSREALACISNNFYERPSWDISVIGVTGTNGKTTTTYLIKSILEAWKRDVGLIGTLGYLVSGNEYAALHTTPESPEFQGLLREMASSGCNYVVTEVSSHALAQKRVDYTLFDIGVFTNLTRDHLDYHKTMEEYFGAKKRLFTDLLSEDATAVINMDDEWGRRLASELNKRPANDPDAVITYGIDKEADVVAVDIENSFSGVSFALQHKNKSFRIDSPLIGSTSVYNILAAVSVAIALDIPDETIMAGIREIKPVKGRLEKIDYGQDFLCIIDYAHTPDALERLLATARELISKVSGSRQTGLPDRGDSAPRIITVFGCGGNRDKGKRPIMGGIATKLSDYVIITSDNPRKENPLDIIKDIEAGVAGDNYHVVPDRREAINAAVARARAGDIVIIAGKGHEGYQEIGDTRLGFSDKEAGRDAIKCRLKQ